MTISQKNAEIALERVGLLRGGPVHIDDYNQRVAAAARLARFMDQLDTPLPEGFTSSVFGNSLHSRR